MLRATAPPSGTCVTCSGVTRLRDRSRTHSETSVSNLVLSLRLFLCRLSPCEFGEIIFWRRHHPVTMEMMSFVPQARRSWWRGRCRRLQRLWTKWRWVGRRTCPTCRKTRTSQHRSCSTNSTKMVSGPHFLFNPGGTVCCRIPIHKETTKEKKDDWQPATFCWTPQDVSLILRKFTAVNRVAQCSKVCLQKFVRLFLVSSSLATDWHVLCFPASFPTPMEEPKKVLRCHYLGSVQVPRPTGKLFCVPLAPSAFHGKFTYALVYPHVSWCPQRSQGILSVEIRK